MTQPTSGAFTRFISAGQINQSGQNQGTNTAAVSTSGYKEGFWSYNDDTGGYAYTPADPKNLRALAESSYSFTNDSYAGISSVAENWQDPNKNYEVVGIYEGPSTSRGRLTGVNLTGIPENKIFRLLGSRWCFPIAESVAVEPGVSEYRVKFWNSQNRLHPGIKFKITYTVYWRYYPPTYTTGLTDIEGQYDFDVTFDGKTQANADLRALGYPPKPSGTVTWQEPNQSTPDPNDFITRTGEWGGYATYLEKNGSVELVAPTPKFWIKQHA
jgi:hypothetical protein